MHTRNLLLAFAALILIYTNAAPTPSQAIDDAGFPLFETGIANARDIKARDGSLVTRGGLGTSQARLATLINRKSNLELESQFINQSRLQLSNMVSGLVKTQHNLDPKSSQAKQLQSQIASLQANDKKLELQLRRTSTQHDAIQTEIDAVQKIISKNIESSFKLLGRD